MCKSLSVGGAGGNWISSIRFLSASDELIDGDLSKVLLGDCITLAKQAKGKFDYNSTIEIGDLMCHYII